MTRNRVLKGPPPPVPTVDVGFGAVTGSVDLEHVSDGGVTATQENGNQVLKFPEANGGTIGKLQQVVEKLRDIQKLNNQLQGLYPTGSPAWHTCESIDDRVHDAFVLLGE